MNQALVVGLGYVGRAFARALVGRGWTVRATTRDPSACPPEPGVTLERLGERDLDGLDLLLSTAPPDGVIATPDDEGGVLAFGAGDLDTTAELTCDFRNGDLW